MNKDPTSQQFSLFENEPRDAVDAFAADAPAPGKFSNFVAYVDESGDRGMQNLDASYPVFVLAFCIFYKELSSRVVYGRFDSVRFQAASFC
jgi:hypothetical protein